MAEHGSKKESCLLAPVAHEPHLFFCHLSGACGQSNPSTCSCLCPTPEIGSTYKQQQCGLLLERKYLEKCQHRNQKAGSGLLKKSTRYLDHALEQRGLCSRCEAPLGHGKGISHRRPREGLLKVQDTCKCGSLCFVMSY